MCFVFWSAMLDTNNDNSDRFNWKISLGHVTVQLCQNLQDKRYISLF